MNGLESPRFPGGTRREEMAAIARAVGVEEYFKPEYCENELQRNPDEFGADAVNHPAHYKQYPVDVIDIIRYVLGHEGFRAYCIGNELKYRLRAGDKGDAAEDMAKAAKYREFRERGLPEFVREQAS